MDKFLSFSSRTEKGLFAYVLGQDTNYLTKTAGEYHPQVAQYIRTAKPIPGKTQVLLTALGAGEFWGQNANGDYFPAESLYHQGQDYGFETFVTMARVYKHHINKDPKRSYGHVALSVYNEAYKRVELIIVMDNATCPDEVQKLNNGEPVEFSMGCKIPWDECNICGNRAPKVEYYCEHLKYYLNRVAPGTGKVAYAINRKPKFFDISIVIIGADRTAKSLLKVAHSNAPVMGSAMAHQLAEKEAADKIAEIEKKIPANTAPGSQDNLDALVRAIPLVKALEKNIPTPQLDMMAKNYSLQDIVSTLTAMGIILKPQEFQRVLLMKGGNAELANELDSKGICFDPEMCEPSEEHEKVLGLSTARFNPEILRLMTNMISDRSYAAPHLVKRIMIIEKTASDQTPRLPIFFDSNKHDIDARPKLGILPIMMLASGLYAALAKKAPEYATTRMGELVAKNPGLAAALAASVPMLFNSVMGEGAKGNYVQDLEPEIEQIGKRVDEKRQAPFAKIASGNISASMGRMFLGVPAVYMASGILQKSKNYHPDREEGMIKKFVRRNPDIIASALAMDGIMAASGKGTHGMFQKMFKHASVGDFAMDAMVWPLAFGGKGLSTRMLGGFVDQSIVEGSKKLLSKKQSASRINDNGGTHGTNNR